MAIFLAISLYVLPEINKSDISISLFVKKEKTALL